MAINLFIKKNKQQGFTLIEMIVVCAIVGVISATVMFNYSDFRQGIDTRNLAEEMALTVRKAQSFATSSRRISDAQGEKIKAFGIVFSLQATHTTQYSPYAKGFLFYAAKAFKPQGATVDQYTFTNLGTANCNPNTFGITLGTECLEYFSITNQVSTTKLEVFTGGSWSPIASNAQLQIMFFRPTPDATICSVTGFTQICEGNAAGRITISSQNGKMQKTITVWNTGQIAVDSVVQPAASLNCVPNDPRIECGTNINLGEPVEGR
jgi:prepilin-type N-terminal cleavage/methylation domain-containing protein